MSSLIRSGQNNSQVLRDKTADAGFGPNFYTGLMPGEVSKKLLDQTLALLMPSGLMNVAGLIWQRPRYTLR
jgi:hypothetical protein